MEPAAVIFDLDGVLVDSEEQWDEIRRGMAVSAGLPWPAGATREMQGMSTPEWAAFLVHTVGIPGPPERVAAAVIDRMAAAYTAHLPLLPGVVEAVGALAGHWPLAVASSSPPLLIDTVAHSPGLAGRFAATVSSEEVDRGKPAPDVYLAAAARLDADPTRCIAVEDSSNGLRAAAAAGMTVVAVPNKHFPPRQDALDLAGLVLDSIALLTPDQVRTL